jgi:hypothetical protein
MNAKLEESLSRMAAEHRRPISKALQAAYQAIAGEVERYAATKGPALAAALRDDLDRRVIDLADFLSSNLR